MYNAWKVANATYLVDVLRAGLGQELPVLLTSYTVEDSNVDIRRIPLGKAVYTAWLGLNSLAWSNRYSTQMKQNVAENSQWKVPRTEGDYMPPDSSLQEGRAHRNNMYLVLGRVWDTRSDTMYCVWRTCRHRKETENGCVCAKELGITPPAYKCRHHAVARSTHQEAKAFTFTPHELSANRHNFRRCNIFDHTIGAPSLSSQMLVLYSVHYTEIGEAWRNSSQGPRLAWQRAMVQ
ncbi:hypothetical protein RRF57_001591 [Xylaria bambusicola]|uniref:Uncharacterized protein n=1 Tax=Xylaria bambusicola TaxID=326684 RepID=A0AAN7U553_9PEZI